MPYRWTTQQDDEAEELTLWPYQSLPPKGFAAFILATCAMILIPLIALLGTVLLWGILPFVLLAVAGIWIALERNRRDGHILETLTLTADTARLVRQDPRGSIREWESNRYWAKPEMHPKGGPVPHYVTLAGAGRVVEIGAFLSEDERKALYDDLVRVLAR